MRGSISLKYLVLIFAFTVLAGCAAPSHIALKPESVQRITSTDVNVCLVQQEIGAEINKSNVTTFTGGGLLPALIDAAVNNSRAKTAEASVQPLRDALINYDFGHKLTESIQTELNSVEWLHVKNVIRIDDSSSESYNENYSRSEASAVLFISSKYFFSPDFKTLRISSNVELFPKAEELKAYAHAWDEDKKINANNCMYKNTFEHVKSLPLEAATIEEAIQYWGNDNAALVREALDSGADEISRMIASGLTGS